MLRLIHHWNRIICRFEDQWVTGPILRHIGKAALAAMLTCGAAVIPPVAANAGPVTEPPHERTIDRPGHPHLPPVYGVDQIDASPFKFQVFVPGPLPEPEHHKHDVPEPGTLIILFGGLALLAAVLLVRSAPVEPGVRVTIITTGK